jgi:4-amino-4-deoxy-L-arabinose transferase-like glycosyltransferase
MRRGRRRLLWVAALAVLVLAAGGAAAVWLTRTSPALAGTNSIAPTDRVGEVPAGGRLCVRQLWMPAHANAVGMNLATARPGTTEVVLSLATPEGAQVSRATAQSHIGARVVFGVKPLTRAGSVTACVRPRGYLGDVQGTWSNPFLGVNYGPRPYPLHGPLQADVDGRPLNGLVAVRFLDGRLRSNGARLLDGARRAALFRPGFVGPWTYALLAVLIPLLWAAGLLLVRGRRGAWLQRSRRRPPAIVIVAVIAFANGAAWAVLTPPFEGPDEEAHISYAAQLAETGHPPTSDPRRSYASSELKLAMAATHHYSVFRSPIDTRPPWEQRDERSYYRDAAQQHPARNDGGGLTGAANYGPAYYSLGATAYLAAGGSIFNRIFFMRLVSALLSALAAACVFASVRELLPGQPWAAPAAGLSVAFQPMFGFVSGLFNPDAAANLAGALLLYLSIRVMRRGLTPWPAATLAVTLIVGALAKTTVLTLAPAVLLAVVIAARRRRVAPRAWVSLIGAAAATAGAWLLVASVFSLRTAPRVTTQAALPNSPVRTAAVHFADRLAYIWQVFLPPLPFMHRVYSGSDPVPAWTIYVKRTWGSFGWLTIHLPAKAYWLIALGMVAVVALAVRAAVRERVAVRARAGELLVLVLAFITVALAAHYGLARASASPIVLEQGRYLFPAITAAVVVGVGACYAFGRRWAPVLGLVFAGGMMILSGLAQLLVFKTYFT